MTLIRIKRAGPKCGIGAVSADEEYRPPMQLTRHADYALRLLTCLADTGSTRARIAAVAESQAISRTHLMKIANKLSHAGFIEAVRGRGGGMPLACDPNDMNLAAVIRLMEPGGSMVDCSSCHLVSRCNLPGILDRASLAFHAALEKFTLADVIRERNCPQALRLVEA
jgi:Rrf2 family nitric oxide-sensitive transcriptional repressor